MVMSCGPCASWSPASGGGLSCRPALLPLLHWRKRLCPGLCSSLNLALSCVRCGTGCREVHVACPDARIWWKHLLSRNLLWHGLFRAQPLPDNPLERTSCHAAQMHRQDISRTPLPCPRAGKAAAEVPCDGCCMHRKASGSLQPVLSPASSGTGFLPLCLL